MAPETATARRTLTIGADPDRLFSRWQDPLVFGRVMGHVAHVDADGEGAATWTVHRPDGDDLRWQTRVTQVDEAARHLRWQSVGGDVDTAGEISVAPAPNGLGSEVTLDLTLGTATSPLATAVAVVGDPVAGAVTATALRRFKSLVESGEIPTLDRNPSAAHNDCLTIPEVVSDMDALFLSDATPTGFMGADLCNLSQGDAVAVWGCGAVGLMAQQSARLLGAERVFAIDHLPSGWPWRRRWARSRSTTATPTWWRSCANAPAVEAPTPASMPWAWKPTTRGPSRSSTA